MTGGVLDSRLAYGQWLRSQNSVHKEKLRKFNNKTTDLDDMVRDRVLVLPKFRK